MAAPGVASRKTGGRLSKAGEREKEKTLIKLLIHWAPRPQTHWPDCLAGCVCERVCVCVPVSAPPTPNMPSPRVTTSLCPITRPLQPPWPFPSRRPFLDPLSSPAPDATPLGWARGLAQPLRSSEPSMVIIAALAPSVLLTYPHLCLSTHL